MIDLTTRGLEFIIGHIDHDFSVFKVSTRVYEHCTQQYVAVYNALVKAYRTYVGQVLDVVYLWKIKFIRQTDF